MSNERPRLHGFIVSHNPDKKLGSILAKGKKYFFFQSHSPKFDFSRRQQSRIPYSTSNPVAVTFTVWEAKKPGGDPLARDIEVDRAFYDAKRKQRQERMVECERGTSSKEEVLRQRYGADYVPLGRRRDDWLAKNSTVPVSH